MDIKNALITLQKELPEEVALVTVSKTHPVDDIMEAYDAGQRIFGESRPQEMKAKYEALPKNIRWHMIGNLQTNKVKYIAPFVELIHSVDSLKLMETIDRQAEKNDRIIDILLEVRIAKEESKIGWEKKEITGLVDSGEIFMFPNIRIRGLMGIASLTDDNDTIRSEFSRLCELFLSLRERYFGEEFDTLSMGMTSDYRIAVECGSNMVRIGNLIFGVRDYKN